MGVNKIFFCWIIWMQIIHSFGSNQCSQIEQSQKFSIFSALTSFSLATKLNSPNNTRSPQCIVVSHWFKYDQIYSVKESYLKQKFSVILYKWPWLYFLKLHKKVSGAYTGSRWLFFHESMHQKQIVFWWHVKLLFYVHISRMIIKIIN